MYMGLLNKASTAGLFYQKSQSSQNSPGESPSSSTLVKLDVQEMLFIATSGLHALLEIDKELPEEIQLILHAQHY